MVIDSDEVDEEGGSAHHCRDHEGPDEHLLNPSPACVCVCVCHSTETTSTVSIFMKISIWFREQLRGYSLFHITSLFCVQASPEVAINGGGGGVHENGCAQHGSSPAEEKKNWNELSPVKSTTPFLFPLKPPFHMYSLFFLHSDLIIYFKSDVSIESLDSAVCNHTNATFYTQCQSLVYRVFQSSFIFSSILPLSTQINNAS